MKNITHILAAASFVFTAANLHAAQITGNSTIGFTGSLNLLEEIDDVNGLNSDQYVTISNDSGDTKYYTITSDLNKADAITFNNLLDWSVTAQQNNAEYDQLNGLATILAGTPNGDTIQGILDGKTYYSADDDAYVGNATGSFGSAGGIAEFTDFAFEPDLFPSPVDPLWLVNTTDGTDPFRFEMTSVFRGTNPDDPFLTGYGLLTGGGFDDTYGSWNITTQAFSGDVADGTAFNFTFSSSSIAVGTSGTSSAVPEPSTYAMFGTAFVVLGFIGCKKRKVA